MCPDCPRGLCLFAQAQSQSTPCFLAFIITPVLAIAAFFCGRNCGGRDCLPFAGEGLSSNVVVPKGQRDDDRLENYQLILDTLDRSNVLLWWARVVRTGSKYDWKIRTPPQLSENPIFRLASLANQGWLWKDEQSPDRERMNQTSERALAEGASGYQHEFPIIGADAMHWLSEEVIIRPAGPDEWNLAGVVVDVTNRHEAEEARRSTEGQLNQILNGADCLLWHATVVGNPDTQIKWHMFVPPSALFKRIFGDVSIPTQDLLWNEAMVPEWDDIRNLSRRALREDWPDYDQEFHVVTPGYTFCVHEHVSVKRLEPGKWNLVGVIIDMTARRDAETALAAEKERLAVTLGSMNEGVVTIDARGCILFINRAAADMVQWNAAEAVGREVFEVCRLQSESDLPGNGASGEGGPGAGEPRGSAAPDAAQGPQGEDAARRGPAGAVRRPVQQARGRRPRAARRHRAPPDGGGAPARGQARVDRHPRGRHRPRLQQHPHRDPEQPLAPRDGPRRDAGRIPPARRGGARDEARGRPDTPASHLREGGNPVRAAVNLNEIVQEAATFAGRGSGVMSQFDMPPDLWAANVDKAQIGQVVQNLVINATQAMPRGGTLRIAASNEYVSPGSHASLAEGEYVRISVTDTGEGIPPESLGKIFDPYFTTKRLGHGLGLATVFSIIRRHKGHIEVVSSIGKGTTFTFWLPAAPSARPDPPRPKAFEVAGRGGRVLFMDDEEPILTMVEKLMSRMGYEVRIRGGMAARPSDRYRAAKEAGRPLRPGRHGPHHTGARCGGKEAISFLRQYDPGVKAIVSSGYSSDLAMSDFREHGFRGMVAKPYDINELASVIRAVIREPAEAVPHGVRG